jgi:hypothetical protein
MTGAELPVCLDLLQSGYQCSNLLQSFHVMSAADSSRGVHMVRRLFAVRVV